MSRGRPLWLEQREQGAGWYGVGWDKQLGPDFTRHFQYMGLWQGVGACCVSKVQQFQWEAALESSLGMKENDLGKVRAL